MHLDTHIKWQFLDQNHWLMYFTGGSQDSKSIHPCGITACVQTKGRACWSIRGTHKLQQYTSKNRSLFMLNSCEPMTEGVAGD